MKLERLGKNIHKLYLDKENNKVALLSDLHWDNPKCDRELLKKNLDYCLENNIPVHIAGDFFCLMQGRGDRRGNKSDIRPEHNNSRYLDSIVETAVEWFKPYKDILTVIGYGNHETAIIKYQETDLLHWDNPKCDRELLKKNLDYCLENNIPVHIAGDFFCLMQGRGDRRGNKSDIRPEHNNSRYLDSIVETAVEWFKPYKDILTVIGYGNHETAIIKYQETDLLQRFVDLFNLTYKANVYTGGYGGRLIVTGKQ